MRRRFFLQPPRTWAHRAGKGRGTALNNVDGGTCDEPSTRRCSCTERCYRGSCDGRRVEALPAAMPTIPLWVETSSSHTAGAAAGQPSPPAEPLAGPTGDKYQVLKCSGLSSRLTLNVRFLQQLTFRAQT